MHYQARMDRLFSEHPSQPWQHRTLRTLFDPLSSEWGETTMAEKLDILGHLLVSGEDLWLLASEFQEHYRSEGREDIAAETLHGLAEMAQTLLRRTYGN